MHSPSFSDPGLSPTDVAVESWPCCRVPQPSASQQEQQRLEAIAALDLDSSHGVPAFEEAIQLAARFVNAPVGWVSVVTATHETLKATYGLSVLGLGNELAKQRQLPLEAGLSACVLTCGEPVVVPDMAQLSALAQSDLVTTYGIAACCVVPLVTAQQQCIGTLAVVDVQPRSFSQRDVSFLAMAARWGMAEYERTLGAAATLGYTSSLGLEARSPTDTIRLGLISQLVQDLRSPLTAVLGMADMLSREIYGPLTKKQREYTDIVRRSSQTLMAQVAEILELGAACSEPGELVPTAVDITGLGEQVVATLTPMADKLAHTLTLTSEPGEHLWILDQRTVKQIFYHSLHSLIETASENSTIRLHTARKGSNLALTLWVSNPWMGDGLPPAVLRLVQALSAGQYLPNSQETSMASTPLQPTTQPIPSFRNGLGLVLSQSLARHHGGQMQLHGNAATGHRLVIGLPALKNVGIPSTMG